MAVMSEPPQLPPGILAVVEIPDGEEEYVRYSEAGRPVRGDKPLLPSILRGIEVVDTA